MYTVYIYIYIYSFVHILLYTLLGGGGSAIDSQKTEDRNSAKWPFSSTTTGDAPPRKEWEPARSSKIIANYVPIFWSCVMAMLWYDMAMILSIKIV
jgi:hypothetical protein